MQHNTTFDKIEAWLEGRLSAQEARAFEAEVAANPELAEEVEHHRTAQQALDRLAERKMQQNVEAWLNSTDPLPPPPDPFFKWWMTIPLALIAALAGWYFWPAQPNEEPTLPQSTSTQPIADQPGSDSLRPPTAGADPQTPPAPVPGEADKSKTAQPRTPKAYIAVAETNLAGLNKTIADKYGRTMGGGPTGSADFEAGVRAFKAEDGAAAKAALARLTPADGNYYRSAQELLAWLYFREARYAEAAACYVVFAEGKTDADTDWYLLQFYLADYAHRKRDFDNLLREVLDPASEHKHRAAAERLRAGM